MEAAAWGLLGTIVGALASIATTWLTTRSSAKLQQERAREERAERAGAFQRETLLELQDAVLTAVRVVTSGQLEDMKAYAATNRWGETRWPEALAEADMIARRRVLLLAERVTDDELRTKVKGLMLIAHQVALAHNAQDSEIRLQKVSSGLGPMMELIGTVLRRHL